MPPPLLQENFTVFGTEHANAAGHAESGGLGRLPGPTRTPIIKSFHPWPFARMTTHHPGAMRTG
jgi:hypothetical protein